MDRLSLKTLQCDEKCAGTRVAGEIGWAEIARHFVAELEGLSAKRVDAEGWFAFKITNPIHLNFIRRFGDIGCIGAIKESFGATLRGESCGGNGESDRLDGCIRNGLAADHCGNRLPDSVKLIHRTHCWRVEGSFA
jgi:hypothetical protein